MKPLKNFLCLGTCQRSSIPHESVVQTETGAFHLRPGDLAVFTQRGHYVCHRILYRKRFGDLVWYYISSDHGAPDGWVPAYRMEGRVIAINGQDVNSNRLGIPLRLLWGRFRNWTYRVFWSRHYFHRLGQLLNEPLL